VVATALVAILAAPAAAADRSGQTYVALGDSFTAGSGVLPVTARFTPLGCFQSAANYPHLLQQRYRFGRFVDASCGAAKTGDMEGSQQMTVGANPPQFNRLAGGADVVTLGIGGNDMGFGDIILNCPSPVPWGSRCRNRFVRGGVDTLRQRIREIEPRVVRVLDGIRARAPRAAVYVVGYPRIIPMSGIGCWPQLPLAKGDASYLDGIERELNAMLARAAASRGARYVDTYTPSRSADACKPPGLRWVEPALAIGTFVPVHPNNIGELGMASAVARAIGL
jgi:lysophospholipase L1-like esterase